MGYMSAIKIEVQIKANLQWKAFQARGRHWIGICDALGLTLQADRFSELVEDMDDCLDTMFKDLLDTQELPSFLRKRGWAMMTAIPANRKPADLRFSVPFAVRRVNGPPTALHA
jgi:hypothetical protein